MAKNKHRMSNEINAGSMADIAFLLLIFFLVTTTIAEDKGVLVKLPAWSEEPPPEMKLNTRNVYSVLVNAQDQLLVRGEQMKIGDLKNNTKILLPILTNVKICQKIPARQSFLSKMTEAQDIRYIWKYTMNLNQLTMNFGKNQPWQNLVKISVS